MHRVLKKIGDRFPDRLKSTLTRRRIAMVSRDQSKRSCLWWSPFPGSRCSQFYMWISSLFYSNASQIFFPLTCFAAFRKTRKLFGAHSLFAPDLSQLFPIFLTQWIINIYCWKCFSWEIIPNLLFVRMYLSWSES